VAAFAAVPYLAWKESVASAFLDAEHQALQLEISELETRITAPRSPLLEGASEPGNAALDYLELELALREGKQVSAEPSAPRDLSELLREVASQEPSRRGRLIEVLGSEALERVGEELKPEDYRLAEAREEFRRLRPHLRHVRRGVRRERCEWRVEISLGLGDPHEEGLGFGSMTAATLLAYEAATQPSREALETGYTLLAYARDLGRYPSALAHLAAVHAYEVGLRSLARTFARADLSRSDYQEACEVLERVTAPTLDLAVSAARLRTLSFLAQLSGRASLKSGDQVKARAELAWNPFGAQAEGSHADVWRDVERWWALRAEVEAAPQGEVEARLAEFQARLEAAEVHALTRIALVSFPAQTQRPGLKKGARMLRVLAQAHMVRLETGSFPKRAPTLPDADDRAPREWTYSVEEGRARCVPEPPEAGYEDDFLVTGTGAETPPPPATPDEW